LNFGEIDSLLFILPNLTLRKLNSLVGWMRFRLSFEIWILHYKKFLTIRFIWLQIEN
jgi:hypothetical protein